MTSIKGPSSFSNLRPVATEQVAPNIQIGTVNININVGESGFGRSDPFRFPQSESPWRTLPTPSRQQSAAPAGQGLSKATEFGEGAIRTSGGYTIVPEGKDQAWSIYAPGQKPGETPNSRIWGDPHVSESDGTRWDFTKSSNFKLPDGTNIAVKTTSEQGYSLSSALDITNGADRVQVSGIDKNQPVTSAITHDGYEARARLAETDTFLLGGDKTNVKWFRERNGQIDGEITSAAMVNRDGKSFYEQTVNAKSQFVVDPGLLPEPGTQAWGNALRSEAVDIARKAFGSGSNLALAEARDARREDTRGTQERQFLGQLTNILQLFSFFNLQNSFLRPLSLR